MVTIPIQATPSQQLNVVLGGQNCSISIYQKSAGLYVDLTADGVPVFMGRIARDGVPMIIQSCKCFVGNLMFIDTQDSSDPEYVGLGDRYELVYLESADL